MRNLFLRTSRLQYFFGARVFLTLTFLFFSISFSLLADERPPFNSEDDGPCIELWNPFLSFDLLLAKSKNFQFPNTNPITQARSVDEVLLQREVNFNQDCDQFSKKIQDSLLRYYDDRLQYLLDQKKLDEFFVEEYLLLTTRNIEEEKYLRELFLDRFERSYLEKIFEQLTQELSAIPNKWISYTTSSPPINSWNENWLQFLGREVPAAMNIDRGIVLRPLEYNPEELEVFLFHELVHWNDSNFKYSTDKEREILAWDETFQYLDWKKNVRKKPIPLLFQQIYDSIQHQGVLIWVNRVLDKKSKLETAN